LKNQEDIFSVDGSARNSTKKQRPVGCYDPDLMSFSARVKSLGYAWRAFVASLRRRSFADNALVIIAAVVLAPVSLLLYPTRLRILRIAAIGRIGHLAGDVSTFAKRRLLGQTHVHGLLVSPRGVAANDCLVDYWRRYVTVVRSPYFAKVLRHLARFPYLVHDTGTVSMDETAPYIAVAREWGDRPPLLDLSEEHHRRGEAWLERLGLPRGAQFVCFHSREPGYSPRDEALHSFRNSSVENYLPAVEELTRLGFWCLRMGDPSMRPIRAMDKVIDYAHLDSRSDWLDVFLCARCTFFLGSCSGLVNLANVFGRPCAIANQVPFSHVRSFGIADVCIPKLYWSDAQRRLLTFGEIFVSEAANFRFTSQYEARGLRPVENSADEVRDLVLEVLARCDGTASYTPRDEQLQRSFGALMRPGHYSFGGVNRVGRDFLRKYEQLIDAPAEKQWVA
jgi:putative glycosyltransferase (TIGR04372 family)